MKIESKSRILLLLALAIFIGAGLWLFNRAAESPPPDGDVASTELELEKLAPPDEETGLLAEADLLDAIAALAMPAEKSATDSAPLTASPQPDVPATLSAEQVVNRREIETQIEAAFSGDNNEAVELGSFLNQCRLVPQTKERVEQSIERAAQSFAEGKPLKQFRPSNTIQEFDSLESFELEKWNSFYRCDAARGLINDDFWDRLEREADAGNPVARYLFATLQPNSTNRYLGFDQWDEELERYEQSRNYTWRNMEDREPLGLLAYAQAGRSGSRLTSGGASTNVVMTLAAVKCGLATAELLDQVDQMIENLKRMEVTHPGALDQLNTASDEAKRMFCK
ncbi:MAG: hypothetical protein SH820_00280 [Xanthomonadales bacterium]|nr:hypothetical protein [Xanthomonadales bacterium]